MREGRERRSRAPDTEPRALTVGRTPQTPDACEERVEMDGTSGACAALSLLHQACADEHGWWRQIAEPWRARDQNGLD
jgi:hypothetical protein